MSNTERLDRYIIGDFRHIPGYHCGSTALRDLCHFHGYELSESMCFGLGSGIGFYYVNGDRLGVEISPSRLFGGRTATLEGDFFDNIGVPLEWHAGDGFPWAGMRGWIDRDVPILLRCDLKYLDYYATDTHFSGHAAILAGYDETGAFLADTDFEGLQLSPPSSVSEGFTHDVAQAGNTVERLDAFGAEPIDIISAGVHRIP